MDTTTAPAYRSRDEERAAGVFGRSLLLLGTAWVLFSLVIPQLDPNSLRSIAVLLGIVLLASALSEIPTMRAPDMGATDWRRWTHAVLATLFVVGAVIAWAWPDPTMTVLARIVAWYLLFKGIHDIVNALAVHRANRGSSGRGLWWVLLAVGAFEIGLAFWASTYPRYSLTLLVLWIGLAALVTGLTKILTAFRTPAVALQPTGAEGRVPPTGFGPSAVGEAERAERERRARRPIS